MGKARALTAARKLARAVLHRIARTSGLCAVLLSTQHARANEPAARDPHAGDVVELTLPDCKGVTRSEVEPLVELELSPPVRLGAADDAPSIRVRVTCTPDGVQIDASDLARASATHLRIDLQRVAPEARARLLALSIAELIATTRLERAEAARGRADEPEEPQAEPRDDDDSESDDDDEASAAAATGWHVWISPSLSSALVPAMLLVGASAGAAWQTGMLALAGDLSARFGSTGASTADLTTRALSASGSVQVVLTRRVVRIALGPGLRIGHAHLRAEASTPALTGDSVNGLWLGPFAGTSLLLPLSSATSLRLGLEAGYVARPVLGLDEQEDELLALRGPWLSAELGLALSL